MSCLEVLALLKSKGLFNSQVELEFQANIVGIDLSKDSLTYRNFTILFCRPIFFAAICNLCHLVVITACFTVIFQSSPELE